MSTTTSRHETTNAADPALPIIVITREFDAPPDRVFRAYTDPELVVQWLGPRRLTMQIEEYDARTHVSYRLLHIDEDGTEYGFHGACHEVRQDERIVQTFTWDDQPDGVSLETDCSRTSQVGLASRRSRLSTRLRRATRSSPAAWVAD